MKSTRTPRYQELLERLKSARKDRGMTQQELARQLRKPQSFVSKYENGEQRLDVVEFIEIAGVLGVDGHALLRGSKLKK